MLDPEHKHRPNQHAQPVSTRQEAQKCVEVTEGVHHGYNSRSDSIPPSQQKKTRSSSRGTVIPAELVGLQHAPGCITDSPSYIQDLRSALRTPDVILNKTPWANGHISPPHIPTILEPPDVTSGGYFDIKPLNYEGDELADCQDEEAAQWNKDKKMMEGMLLSTKSDRDDDGPPVSDCCLSHMAHSSVQCSEHPIQPQQCSTMNPCPL
jgi:hypothetical protein